MPTYGYVCDACQHRFTEFQTMSEPALTTCPECDADELRRLIGAGAALVFKGSGFYVNDYGKKSGEGEKSEGEGEKSEGEGKKSEGEGKAKSKSESKSETATKSGSSGSDSGSGSKSQSGSSSGKKAD